ncbi:GFA family protein [Roseobacter ponti]|uniref:GFA family protein n=1 Tax=Roseobacter ponti TaxID=1891787 RepID=A0A858STE5_9RHOB|nr:GFA family protein [Roseobacter ponti]QJF51590.1 GFA family protein [Roseobacter ponti]
MSRTVTASCHCGAIVLEAALTADPGSAARCTCSFCARRQAANVSARAASVRVIRGAGNLSLYTWGTHRAKHWFCRTCGIYTHHQRFSDPSECGINVGCIEGVHPWELEPFAWNDGHSLLPGEDED